MSDIKVPTLLDTSVQPLLRRRHPAGIDYRVKLILDELMGFKPDIISLQETDRQGFSLKNARGADPYSFFADKWASRSVSIGPF